MRRRKYLILLLDPIGFGEEFYEFLLGVDDVLYQRDANIAPFYSPSESNMWDRILQQ